MNQKIISLAIGVIAVLAVIAFAIFGDLGSLTPGGGEDSGAVAVVNGEEITREAFNARVAQTEQVLAQQGQSAQLEDETVRSELEQQIVNQMISETLFLQKAEEQGITVSSDEIDAQIATFVEQVGGEEEFENQLSAQSLTEEELRDNVEQQIRTQKFISANVDTEGIEVTDEEVTAFYEQISAQQEGVPPLEEIEAQVRAQLVSQQENQLINSLAQELRSEADVEVLL